MTGLYIGLMSGTSMDGVDGVLVELPIREGRIAVRGHAHRPFDAALVDELLALNTAGGTDELHRAALAGNAVTRRYAEVVEALLAGSGVAREQVRALGAHGQTVRHRPGRFDGTGYTLQLGNPALLAESAGIDVVADLRSRDVAAGGQGAPLVPAFHRALFGRPGEVAAVLNLGGIANLTLLDADGGTRGFDCGPANALMDHWYRRHASDAFDRGGAWAASGTVVPALLQRLRDEPYFRAPPPKSTGRDLFDPAWLEARLGAHGSTERPENVQATLAELTASVCLDDLERFAPATAELLVCGGGAFNDHLMTRLAALAGGRSVSSTATRGLPPDQVEAAAFAWLAEAFLGRRPGNLPAVTGATGPRVLGALYPAR